MPTPVLVRMELVQIVEFDARNLMMMVVEHWSERHWFRVVKSERIKSYTLNVGVGRWMYGDTFILNSDPRHFRLMEIWAAWMAERKLDDYVGLDWSRSRLWLPPAREQPVGPLPPVPVLAPRAPLPRR